MLDTTQSTSLVRTTSTAIYSGYVHISKVITNGLHHYLRVSPCYQRCDRHCVSQGKQVFIPRIILTPTASAFPVPFKRKQFPINLAFAMTINKAEGQTLSRVGIYLPDPAFAHGQFVPCRKSICCQALFWVCPAVWCNMIFNNQCRLQESL